jgi:hypothetical protein
MNISDYVLCLIVLFVNNYLNEREGLKLCIWSLQCFESCYLPFFYFPETGFPVSTIHYFHHQDFKYHNRNERLNHPSSTALTFSCKCVCLKGIKISMKRKTLSSVLTHSLAQESLWLNVIHCQSWLEWRLKKVLYGNHFQLGNPFFEYEELKAQQSPNHISNPDLVVVFLVHGLFRVGLDRWSLCIDSLIRWTQRNNHKSWTSLQELI